MRVNTKELFIDSLLEIDAIKFGNFKLKSGETSPYYVDLRLLISHHKTLALAGQLLVYLLRYQQSKKPTVLCGIPSAGVPIATIFSQKCGYPLIISKKEPIIFKEMIKRIRNLEKIVSNKTKFEVIDSFITQIEKLGGFKGHGLQKYIDGEIHEHATIGLVDDLISTGNSKTEVIELLDLERERLGLKDVKITDVYVLLDREQGGSTLLENKGIKVHSVLKITQVFDYLSKTKQIDQHTYETILKYLKISGYNGILKSHKT